MIRAILVTLLLASAAQAETIDVRDAKLDVCGAFELYHINGIMTDIQGAQDNTDRIREVYGNAYNGHLIKYALAYNQHRNFFVDMYDSALQIINLYARATWDKWMNAVTNGIYSLGMSRATTKAITTAIVETWGFTRPNPYTDQEMNEIMAVIQAKTSYGSRIVMAPHSQGNFYSDLVYDKLIALGIKPAKSIGVVGLAVPYSSVRGGNTYLTSANDLVIDSVRVATLNNVLRPTHSIPYDPFTDKFGHKLIQTYLAHAPTRDAYVPMITAKFDTLRTVATGPYWAPPDQYGGYSTYVRMMWHEPLPDPEPAPAWYWYYEPEPYSGYTGAWSGYLYGSLEQATTVAMGLAQICYNYHITETIRRQDLGDYSWVTLLGGCYYISGDKWSGSWWPYSGDGAPVFRQYPAWNRYDTAVNMQAGATCKN